MGPGMDKTYEGRRQVTRSFPRCRLLRSEAPCTMAQAESRSDFASRTGLLDEHTCQHCYFFILRDLSSACATSLVMAAESLPELRRQGLKRMSAAGSWGMQGSTC